MPGPLKATCPGNWLHPTGFIMATQNCRALRHQELHVNHWWRLGDGCVVWHIDIALGDLPHMPPAKCVEICLDEGSLHKGCPSPTQGLVKPRAAWANALPQSGSIKTRFCRRSSPTGPLVQPFGSEALPSTWFSGSVQQGLLQSSAGSSLVDEWPLVRVAPHERPICPRPLYTYVTSWCQKGTPGFEPGTC